MSLYSEIGNIINNSENVYVDFSQNRHPNKKSDRLIPGSFHEMACINYSGNHQRLLNGGFHCIVTFWCGWWFCRF